MPHETFRADPHNHCSAGRRASGGTTEFDVGGIDMGEFFAVLVIAGLGYLEYRRRVVKAAKERAMPASVSEQKKNYLYIGLMLAASSAAALLIGDSTAAETFGFVAGLVGGLALIYKSSTMKDGATAGQDATGARVGIADEIAKFALMREQGVLTDDEFEHQKSQLLAGAQRGVSADLGTPEAHEPEPDPNSPRLPSSLKPLLQEADRAYAEWVDPSDDFFSEGSAESEERIAATLESFMAGARAAGVSQARLVSILRARFERIAGRPFFERVLEA